MSEVFKEIKGSLTMRQIAEHFGYAVNRSGFILSPFGEEKTASCKLYQDSYYDFSAATGGDLIHFTAAILHVNNWEACQYLVQAFSLPVSLSGGTDRQEEIGRRQRAQQRQQERQQEFKAALLGEIERLKRWEQAYQRAITEKIYPPLSEMYGYVVSELQKVSYKLDILCAVDQEAYRRMKPDVAGGLPSDYPQWLWDTLAILEEDGLFQVTQGEKKRILAKGDFELQGRRPGKDRGYCVA